MRHCACTSSRSVNSDYVQSRSQSLRSPWPAVGKRELWEQPFWNNWILVILSNRCHCAVCIYGACLKWLLPELSFSDRWSRGIKTLGTRLPDRLNHQNSVISKWLLPELSFSDRWSRGIKTLGMRLPDRLNHQNSVISKWLLPELSFSDCWSRGMKALGTRLDYMSRDVLP